jgi:hypothetical protein
MSNYNPCIMKYLYAKQNVVRCVIIARDGRTTYVKGGGVKLRINFDILINNWNSGR